MTKLSTVTFTSKDRTRLAANETVRHTRERLRNTNLLYLFCICSKLRLVIRPFSIKLSRLWVSQALLKFHLPVLF